MCCDADSRRQYKNNTDSRRLQPPLHSKHIVSLLLTLQNSLILLARRAQNYYNFLQSMTFKRDENTLIADTFFSNRNIQNYLCIILLCAARTAQSITIFLQSITFKRDENTLIADTFFSNRYILTYLLFSTLVLNV